MSNLQVGQDPHHILPCLELFSVLEKHFALFIARLAKKHKRTAALSAALISRKTSEGSICLEINELAGKPLPLDLKARPTNEGQFICPSMDDWAKQLMESGVVCRGSGGKPLVLDRSGRLYLKRYWDYEDSIRRFIEERATAPLQDLSDARFTLETKDLFDAQPSGEIDWQQVGAIAAATRSFCVISGGPGTGKTTIVSKILALLKKQRNSSPRRILLGAPTGKAAARLQQTIAEIGIRQSDSEPLQATTLHRMLGFIPNSPYFLHNAENPLAADIIIIDEASMVDLPLMAKLMQAIPASARLILLGDRHQLASVQPGSVLGDICRSKTMADFSQEFNELISGLTGCTIVPQPPPVTKKTSPAQCDSFVELTKSYRFTPESGIARLSMAVKLGDENGALDILLGTADGSIAWSEIPAPDDLGEKLRDFPTASQFTAMQENTDPDSCFKLLDNFRILGALRNGPYGTKRINALLEKQILQVLSKSRANRPAGVIPLLPVHPVMVTQNNYTLKLFNGDIGIIMRHPENPQSLRAFFRGESGILRDITPTLLPEHEAVFAMTVHKSQGSEFNNVLLILPDQDSPLLTRELLYTAITRAKKKVEIWGSKAIFAAGVKRQIIRTSGLAEALWGENK